MAMYSANTQACEAYNFYVDAQPDPLAIGCFTGFWIPALIPGSRDCKP